MKKIWNAYGKRITALVMALFLIFLSMPCSGWGVLRVAAEETAEMTEFGTEEKIIFTSPITLVLDGTKPTLHLNPSSTIIGKTETSVDISGMVTDDNFEKLICSSALLTEAEVLTAVNNVMVETDGTFTHTIEIPNESNEITYYFYAVDKAGLCSDVQSATIYRDVTSPKISSITLNDLAAVHSYAHGNYSKEAVTVKITANDEGTTVSGIRKIRLFFENETEAFKELTVVGSITDGTDYEFSVELTPVIAELASLREIQVSAVDNKGNESVKCKLFASGNSFQNNRFMFDQHGSSVIRESVAEYEKTDENGNVLSGWYKEIPENIVFALSDKTDGNTDGSGLLSVNVGLDDSDMPAYAVDNSRKDAALQESKTQILKADINTLSKGEHRFVINAKDFAENETTETFIIGIDDGAPIVKEAKFEEAEAAIGSFDFGGFGNYHGKSVKITIQIADTAENGSDDTTKTCVGAKEAELYLNGVLYKTTQVDENNYAIFTIPENLLENQFFKYTQISVITRDFLGNQSEHTIIEETQNGSLIIETKKPVIMDVDIKTKGDNALRAEKTESSAVFYCKTDENGKPDIDFIVKASDKDDNSGLEKIKVVFNEQVVFEENYAENLQLFATLTEGEKIFSLKNSSLASVSEYNGTITVTDKAGNETVFLLTVHVDEDGPIVGTPEITVEKSKVMNVSYYNGNIVVTTAPQDTSVGVDKIEWGTIGANHVQNKVGTVTVKEDGKASFVIMPSSDTTYEEKIYIKAIDKLGNVGQAVELNKFVIETQEQHNKQNANHIQVTKKMASPYKDGMGNLLYTGTDASAVLIGVAVEDTYNGIKSVEWTVSSEAGAYTNLAGSVTVDSETLAVTGTTGTWNVVEKTDFATKINGEFTVDASAIEADNITVTVKMTDLSGNISTGTTVFSVDNTAPVINVEFDDVLSDSEFTNVYKDARTATITVVDRNFGAEQLVLEITNKDGSVPQISDWTTTVNAETPNATTSVAKLVFAEDGDYSISVSGKDMAGLSAQTVTVEEFTIDTINPVIKVNYTNDNVINANYYAQTQTAVITIEEHNFAEERIEIVGTATLDGADTAFPVLGAWSSEGDTHTATLTFETDGLYQFNVDYKDKAGRDAEKYTGEEFYVDMTAPVIEITGVEDLSANNGEVAPRISITDFNYNTEGITIDLYGANGGNRALNGAYSSQANGQIFTFANFEEEQSNDDIYTVTVTALDMAGNETVDEISFSVNRFGSVYVFDNSLKEIAGMYVQDEIDVRLTEVNVDSLEHDTIRVVVNANGSITDLQEGTDYTVSESGGNGAWYQYDYIIDKSLFAGDGRYIVTLYSEDAAGNINENIDESKKAEISFGIDKTPPVIIPIDIASEEQYAQDVKTATVAVNDNLVLQDVQVFVGENQSEYTAEGENYVFDIPSSSDRQDITIAAVDAAGNRTNYVISGVLVTTNAFIRWYNNTPLFVGSIAGTAVLSGAGVGGFAFMKGRSIKVKTKKR